MLVGLPAGESVRVKTIDDEATTDGNVYVGSSAFSVDYLIGSGDAVYSLGCRHLEHSGDDGSIIASR